MCRKKCRESTCRRSRLSSRSVRQQQSRGQERRAAGCLPRDRGNIQIFDNSKARDGLDKNRTAHTVQYRSEVASHFAGDQAGQKVAGIQLGHANVLPVHLRVENPYIDENGDYAYGGGATAADIEELKAQATTASTGRRPMPICPTQPATAP